MGQRCILSTQLQDERMEVALLSHIHTHKTLCDVQYSSYHFYLTGRLPGRKGGTAFPVQQDIPHSHVDLPSLVSVEATGIFIQIGNCELLLADFYKSPSRIWRDADITQLFKS
jgi:hypothetical protein